MARDIQLLNDRSLADRARRGDADAFSELYRRHQVAAWRLAWAVVPDEQTAATSVASGFAGALARTPSAPVAAGPRAQLLGQVRQVALDQPHDKSGQPAAAVPAVAAFRQMPELWRSSLWLTAVETVSTQEAASILGIERTTLSPLAARARTGLVEGALAVRAESLTSRDCRRAADALPAYAAGLTSPRESARLRRHLDRCAGCRTHLVELDDLIPILARAVPAAPQAIEPDALAAWRALTAPARGPMHLALPGGHTVPAWAERAVGGAAAAVVALGVFSATLLAGRGGRVEDPIGRSDVAAAPGFSDGESAAGAVDDDPPTLDGGVSLPPFDPPPPSSTPPQPPAGGGADSGEPEGGNPQPDPSTPPPAPGPSSEQPSTPSNPAPAPSSPPTTAPPAQNPALDVSVSVGDALTLQVGDSCTGLELLGTTVGCVEGSEGGGLLEIDTGGSLLPPIKLGL